MSRVIPDYMADYGCAPGRVRSLSSAIKFDIDYVRFRDVTWSKYRPHDSSSGAVNIAYECHLGTISLLKFGNCNIYGLRNIRGEADPTLL